MTKHLMNHRFLGVVFMGLLAFGVWMVNAVFTQKFVSFDKVTVETSTVGLNLPARADVKVRGMIVGQVLEARSQGGRARLVLGIKPEQIHRIPANVTASILPKTLFGEKYIELNVPASAASVSLRSGDSIKPTQLPLEVEQVLNDLYPLLRTVQPAELSYTLNALADALEGRGEKLGDTVVTLDHYLKRINPQIPELIADIKLLAQVSDTYADVMPQLASTLRNTVKTGNTLVSREAKLNQFLKDSVAFSDTATGFLNQNGNNIVRLGEVTAPVASLLARYSPGFPCMLDGIVKQAPMLGDTFRGFVFHINLKIVPQQPRGYNARDLPVYGADNGPACHGLPNPKVPFKGMPNLNDGVSGLGRGDAQRTATGFDQTALTTGTSGTASQKAMLNSLAAPVMGVPYDEVPDLAALLMAPSVAGTEVSVR